ncbi:MAG TPA: YicC family protein [Phycisphaerae bacterium]|nr:YicC family protein [Phycisphaerae bacterium]HOJ75429.1 YicC family protein [Phycisphaerae bacterium]HOM49620.1 YicC family protein [Phycisphaerae bacterium]HON65415.1 YicC family protein [Phycisphaerae bacterium]HOQ84123.1 YicC family protein [Phycisphaerae bacterium]
MILSMTGYGEAQHVEDGVAYALELKSLNNRYLKTSIKLPEHLSVFESEVEKLLRERLDRGSVTFVLRVRDHRADAAQEINVAAIQSYLAQLGKVTTDAAVQIDVAALLALPGVIQPPEISEAERERQWKVIASLADEALKHLLSMRQAEGLAIREDLLGHCRQIRTRLAVIAERAPQVVREYHEKLLARANELLAQSRLQLELDDLRREIAVFAERCDISEEIARLTSHLDQFAKLCDSSERAGRKLDFLAQEMLREANTIGSKANDATIAHNVIEIKGAIDRLKEQVQNVE